MYYLPLAILTWLIFWRLIDWSRLPELLVYGLAGTLIGCMEDKFGRLYGWWIYRDSGPFDNHVEISMIIALSAAPLFSLYFVQGLRGDRLPWVRIALFTAISMVPEVVGLYTGHIVHQNGWNTWWSVVAHLPTWFTLWGLHRFYKQPQSQRHK